jgi:hypothetical protein
MRRVFRKSEPSALFGFSLFVGISMAIAMIPVSAQTVPGKVLVQGVVTGSAGTLLTNAQLVVHWDPSGSTAGLKTNVGIPEDRFLKTDTHGAFYAEIPPGFYDVFVTAQVFPRIAGRFASSPAKTPPSIPNCKPTRWSRKNSRSASHK